MHRAQQILEEILVALARRSEQVGSPDKQIAREIDRVIGIGERKIHRTRLQTFGHIRRRSLAHAGCFLRQRQRIGVEVRRGWQPAHPGGAQVVVNLRPLPLFGIGQRRQNLAHRQLFVAPLAAVNVEK